MPEKKLAAIILCNEESSAIKLSVQAVMRTMLDQEPQAGPVSWMVPIGAALQAGGIQAAYGCYAELKNKGSKEYFFDDDGLVTLVYQLMGVNKIDLAIDVLLLNIHAFPDHVESYTLLANLYTQKSEQTRAEDIIQKAQAITAR